MKNEYCPNWEETKNRFTRWWNNEYLDRPLMRVVAKGKSGTYTPVPYPTDVKDRYLDTNFLVKSYRNYCDHHYYLADSYPAVSIDIGAGSMALYLGSEPKFATDTVWFSESIHNVENYKNISFDPENKWWKKHIRMANEAKLLVNDDFLINMPDIIENIDIIAALRGPQELCYDLMDEPDLVRDTVKIIDKIYLQCFDSFYNILKSDNNSTAFTAFNIWGPGKTAKIQCDFCALMAPDQFREIILPSLKQQCQKLDNTIYHLDGPDAIRHVPALMEIPELRAIQWESGAGQPDGGSENWYPLYDKIIEAGKALWIGIFAEDSKVWAEKTKNLIKRYGPKNLYLLYPEFDSLNDAIEFITNYS